MDSSEPKDEPVVTMSIMDDLVGMPRVEDGWLGDIVVDELSIQLELVLATNSNKADVIMSATEGNFTSYYLENDMIFSWKQEWLEEYGNNIITYRQEQLKHVTEISGNTLCGFSGTGKSQYVYAISKDCAHPEVAMQFLNWLTDPDNMLTIYYGPQGLC